MTAATIPVDVALVRLVTDGTRKTWNLVDGDAQPLYFLDPSHLHAQFVDAAGAVADALVYGADFTVGGDGMSGTGTLTTTATAALAAGGVLVAWRATPVVQDQDFAEDSGNPSSRFTSAANRRALIEQELERDGVRAVRAPLTDGLDMVLPPKAIGAGNLIERADDGTIRNDRSVDDVVALATSDLSDGIAEIIAAGDAQTARVVTEGNSQVPRVADEGDTQTARVTAEGATQVGLVQSAGTTAVEAVEAVADELVELAAIFDTTRRRWVFGQEMSLLIRDGTHRMGAAIGTNGLFYANHAIRAGSAANGVTFARAADGFYDINFGDTPGELPLGAGAKAVSTRLRYFGGQAAALVIRDSNGRVAGAIGADGTFSPTKLSLASLGSVLPSRDSVHIGDSLTKGVGSTAGNDYPSVYGRLRGTQVINLGIGGQKSTPACARLGGVVVGVTLDDGTIDAGDNTVTHLGGVALAGMTTVQDPDYRLLSTPADDTTRGIKGWLCNVYGTLTRTATGGPPSSTSEVYVFTPDSAPASPVPCAAASPFIVDVSGYAGKTLWIEVGANNYNTPDIVCADIAATVAFWQSLGLLCHIGILTTINGPAFNMVPGGAAKLQIETLNKRMLSTWPHLAVDYRRGLIDRGLAIAGITPTALDIIDMALDWIPNSLRWLRASGTLGTTINSSATTFALSVAMGSVDVGNVLVIGAERITISGLSGSTVTNCVRGDLGTTAAGHTSGAAFEFRDAGHLNDDGYAAKAFLCDEFSTARGW